MRNITIQNLFNPIRIFHISPTMENKPQHSKQNCYALIPSFRKLRLSGC